MTDNIPARYTCQNTARGTESSIVKYKGFFHHILTPAVIFVYGKHYNNKDTCNIWICIIMGPMVSVACNMVLLQQVTALDGKGHKPVRLFTRQYLTLISVLSLLTLLKYNDLL